MEDIVKFCLEEMEKFPDWVKGSMKFQGGYSMRDLPEENEKKEDL